MQLSMLQFTARLDLAGFVLVSDPVPRCLCGCCHSPRQQGGSGGCSGFLSRARWHQVLERRWHLVQLAPAVGVLLCIVTQMRTAQGVLTPVNLLLGNLLVALVSDGVWHTVSVPLQSSLLSRIAVK